MSEMLFPVSRHAAILGKRFFAWFLVGKNRYHARRRISPAWRAGGGPRTLTGFLDNTICFKWVPRCSWPGSAWPRRVLAWPFYWERSLSVSRFKSLYPSWFFYMIIPVASVTNIWGLQRETPHHYLSNYIQKETEKESEKVTYHKHLPDNSLLVIPYSCAGDHFGLRGRERHPAPALRGWVRHGLFHHRQTCKSTSLDSPARGAGCHPKQIPHAFAFRSADTDTTLTWDAYT